MKNYEIMYILMPDLDAEGVKQEIDALHKILTDNGGKITGVKEWGMRDLAYQIKKQTKGYYVITEVSCESKALNEFDRITRLDPKVIRFLITATE